MSLPDPESGRQRVPQPASTDRAFGVGVGIGHAVRAGTRMLRAAARTGVHTVRHMRPLLATKDVPLTKSPWSTTADDDHDVIDPDGTTAAVVNNHERDRFDLWVGDELVGVLGYLDVRDTVAGASSETRMVAFMHTVVAEEWTGKGLGPVLVREAFAQARSRHWTVRLVCPYAQHLLTDQSHHDRI